MNELQELQNIVDVEKNFKHIPYSEKIARAYQEILDTDHTKVIQRWWKERDDYFGWIYWGKIYLIWAQSWMWKSTFMNQVSNNVSMMWHKVVRYSLEDRLEDIWKEDIFYQVNKLRREVRLDPYRRVDFCNWVHNKDDDFIGFINKASAILIKKDIIELEKTKKVTIDELCILMEQEADKWAEVFFIDHLHYFEMSWKDRRDIVIENAMHKINEIARRKNVAVFLVAHYKKTNNMNWDPTYDMFKDWSAIFQVANIVIQIEREIDSTLSEFYTTKIRWPIKPQRLQCHFDIDKYEYKFTKSNKLKKKEADFKWLSS